MIKKTCLVIIAFIVFLPAIAVSQTRSDAIVGLRHWLVCAIVGIAAIVGLMTNNLAEI
jgi:hypothetical protein